MRFIQAMTMSSLIIASLLEVSHAFVCDKDIDMIVSGTSTPSLLMQELGQLYAAQRSAMLGFKVSFTYNSVSNGVIWDRLLKRSLDQKITQMAFTYSAPSDVKAIAPIVAVPLMSSYTGITFNLPGINNINLTIPMLADIYMGKISMWNDNRLQLANPGVELPRARTTPVGRYEQSADSSDFTTILSAFSSEWNKTYGVFDSPNFKNGICCNSSSWPSAVWLYGSRAAGMIGVVSSIPYTVGFANAVSLVSNNMTVASLANELGNYLYPSVKSAQKAIEYWVERKSIDRSDISNAIDSDAYPIVSYMELSFIGLGHNLSMDCCTARELVGFVELVLSDYGQSLASNKYLMVPLIEQVKLKVRQVLQTLTCREQNVSQAYFESIALNQGANIISSHALIIGIVVALVVLILLFLFLLYDQRKRKLRLRINAIKIHSGNLKPLKDSKSLASRSTLTLKSDYSSFQHFSDSYMFMLNDSQVMGQIITDINFHSLKLPSLLQLSIFREEVLHENLLPFLGITSFNAAECLLISQFDCRLKLHDFLSMEKYEMTDDIRYNLIQDVIQGMKFLHNRQMAHLLLSSHTCYLDRSWRVKIGQWEINKFLSVENLTSFENITKFKEQMLDNNSLIRLLYLDPMAMSDRTFAHYSDVFSFSYLLFEIFTKQLPFDLEVELHGTTFEDLLKKKYFMMEDLTLEVPEQVPEPIRNLIKDCQNSQREKRPTFQQIEDQMIIKKCRAKKEVIELLIDAVETYLAGLEDTVATRTAAVKDMNVRLTAILSEVLPTEISTRLLKGEEVHPESFDCVTVLFVAIDDFDTLSSQFTPLEIMGLLNDLWIEFDSTIGNFDAYKMDTINEVYMICSGLPVRNGFNHVKVTADLAIALISVTLKFDTKIQSNSQLKIKMGIHSGPVTAGIVGTKMPQYCVFGDTVNTASRMESTSCPMKIQISESTQRLLTEYFPEYLLKYRGETQMKGKGTMKTYWLEF